MSPVQWTLPIATTGAKSAFGRWLDRLRCRRERARLDTATRHLTRELLRDIGLEAHPDDFGARLPPCL